jgi:hypothetical protein
LTRLLAVSDLPPDTRGRARLWLGAYSTLSK